MGRKFEFPAWFEVQTTGVEFCRMNRVKSRSGYGHHDSSTINNDAALNPVYTIQPVVKPVVQPV